mgnify:FL=1
MYKSKLIKMRRKLGFTQDRMAEALCMDVSCYCRRESGQIKIPAEQWLRIAKILGVSLEEIYESEDELISVEGRNNATIKCAEVRQYTLPEEILDRYKKHIEMLEMELNRLKELLKLAAR